MILVWSTDQWMQSSAVLAVQILLLVTIEMMFICNKQQFHWELVKTFCLNHLPLWGLSGPSNFIYSMRIHWRKNSRQITASHRKAILFINNIFVNLVCFLIWYKLSWNRRSKKWDSGCLSPVQSTFNKFSLNQPLICITKVNIAIKQRGAKCCSETKPHWVN